MVDQALPLLASSFGPSCISKALALRQAPLAFARARYAAHGSVFSSGMLGQHTIGLAGEATQHNALIHTDQCPPGTVANRFAHTLMRDGMLWIDEAQWSRAHINHLLHAILAKRQAAPKQDRSTNDNPLNRPTGDVLITFAV
jgi:hypothetical protein